MIVNKILIDIKMNNNYKLIILNTILTILIVLSNLYKSEPYNTSLIEINNPVYTNIKIATVILTKGYNNLEGYNDLIKRNISIYNTLCAKYYNIDNIIFHEGNITYDQQIYIQSRTPNLLLKFYKINFIKPTKKNELCKETSLSNGFSNGYKNMCHFWTIGFLENEHLNNYDYIFRIDEDCILQSIPDNIFELYLSNNVVYSSPFFQGDDDPDVTIGMNTFFNEFVKNNNLQIINKNVKNPYTNVFIMDITYFKNHKIIRDVLKELENTNCIFNNRWGDLPIWGYLLSYFINPSLYLEDKKISYIHGSHEAQIN